MRDRVRLFESVVSPCALHAFATWTLTGELAHTGRTTRRRMLSWVARVPRYHGEAWVERIQRATRESERIFESNGAKDWVAQQRIRVWKLAGRTAASPEQKWSKHVLTWRPWFRVAARRSVGHPLKRWDDEIVQLVGGDWPQVASESALWACLQQ